METKKSQKANLEKYRVVLFQTGLVVSLLFAITLLSWNFKVVIPDVPDPDEWDSIEIDPPLLPVIIKKPDAPKPSEAQKQKPDDIIKIIDDATKLEDPEKSIIPEAPEMANLSKDAEEPTGEIDLPKPWALRMPSYKECSKLEMEEDRKLCTEKKLIEEIYIKISNKNINNVSGIVYVEFVVGRTGKIKDVKVIRGIDNYIDKEVVKAIQSLGDFIPGDNNGIPAEVIYKWPIKFTVK